MNTDVKNFVTIQISDNIFWGYKQVFSRNYIQNISLNELSDQINSGLVNFLTQNNLLNLVQHVPKYFHFHDTQQNTNIIYACTSCFNTINTLYNNNLYSTIQTQNTLSNNNTQQNNQLENQNNNTQQNNQGTQNNNTQQNNQLENQNNNTQQNNQGTQNNNTQQNNQLETQNNQLENKNNDYIFFHDTVFY